MKVEQVQVEVDELVKGMYVCALDRPWLSTPFPFQGFVVRTEEEIAQLRRYCNYVYVDVLRGVPPVEDRLASRSWKRDAPKVVEPEPVPRRKRSETQRKPKPAARKPASAEAELSRVQAHAAAAREPRSDVKSVPIPVRHDRYEAPRALRKELRKAVSIHRDLSRSVSQVLDDIRVGRGLEVVGVRKATDKMVDSIIRHPDALIWLGRLRDKDQYAYAHSIRSSILAVALARHLGLHEPQLQKLALGALFCEIGKAKLPGHLLKKRGPLPEEEIRKLQEHVALGVELLDRCIGMDDEVIEVVHTHHERFDGTGYPNGLSGDRIPLLGRIAGMIDCYDAMTSSKPYTEKVCSTSEAIDFFYAQRDGQFHGQLVDEFIQAIGLYPTGTMVELNSGEVGVVLAQDIQQRLQPEVLIVLDRNKQPVDPPRQVHLKEFNASRDETPVSIRRAVFGQEFGLDPGRILEAHTAKSWDWRKLAWR